jgi:LAO/AO transport system kinase
MGGHHGPAVGASTPGTGPDDGSDAEGRESEQGPGTDPDTPAWDPRVVTTVATAGDGIDDLVDAFDAHASSLRESGAGRQRARSRHVAEIRRLVREDTNVLLDAEIRRRGGLDALAERVLAGDTDPYTVASGIVEPIADCVDGGRPPREAADDPDTTAERGPDGDA